MVRVANAWSLHPHNIETFAELLVDLSQSRRAVVDAKLHLTYFKEYFESVGVATLLVEHSYVDRDFLEDYAAYYVRCFADYPSAGIWKYVSTSAAGFDDACVEATP